MSAADGSLYTYLVARAAGDEFVATCLELPSLSWLDPSPEAALRGLRRLVAAAVADLRRGGEPVPAPGGGHRATYRAALEAALAERYTSPHGARNRAWDPEGPDDETNPYLLAVPLAERIERGSMMEVFTAGDGHLSMAPVSIRAAAAAVLEVRDVELARLRAERDAHVHTLDHVLGELHAALGGRAADASLAALPDVLERVTRLREELAAAQGRLRAAGLGGGA